MNGFSTDSGARPRMYKVVSPVERKDATTYWMRVGNAFLNKDNSINVYLDAVPTNHKFQIREMDEDDFRKRRPDGATADSPAARTPVQASLNDIPF